ncbi:MAG: hypothetical protein IAI50_06540 [Candidatus Eremiobacteraeota bacterium]|nr:hypothetical protein [Candidatus Eremiobacteraeota bacterium]
MKTKGRYRRVVVRHGRRYVVCGLSSRPAPVLRRQTTSLEIWIPAATFMLVIMLSAYLIGQQPFYPLGTASVPHGAVARFTINDFANASR